MARDYTLSPPSFNPPSASGGSHCGANRCHTPAPCAGCVGGSAALWTLQEEQAVSVRAHEHGSRGQGGGCLNGHITCNY